MNQWSMRRKRMALAIVVGVLIIIIGVPLYFFLKTTPTCFDGKQNSDETGIDCGGSCKLLCSAGASPIINKGDARILKVATSTYEVVVSLENPNPTGSIQKAGYSFKIYKEGSLGPIKIIQGQTYVPKASKFAIFEGPFNLGEVVPTRVVFEWDKNTLIWEKDLSKSKDIKIEESILSGADTAPRLEAQVKNSSLEQASNIELVALIIDSSDSIIGASKTFVDVLEPGASTPIVFTWPQPFTDPAVHSLILMRELPDSSFIK